ncbi:hypothetical protein [Colwellia sp. MEBiC06753]
MKYMVVILALVTTGLVGCSSANFNSNLGKYAKHKVQNSIRKSVVKRYTNYEVWERGGTLVGYVESDFCRQYDGNRGPSVEGLIEQLEIEAQLLGGNALVFDSCQVDRTSGSCVLHTVCRGNAYFIKI